MVIISRDRQGVVLISVPNQRIVQINRAQTSKKNFTQIDKDIIQKVFNDLSYPEFKLWYYLCGNMHGYKVELSFIAVENQTGIKRSSYYDSFKSLQEKGYLKLIQGNLYNFFELPVREPDELKNPARKPKKIVEPELASYDLEF